ncbi:diflavin flavoprotein [Nodosilinea sp. LEGE 06152]|uniref:diflavin flavoprotein n=1 Tax=Nodosilinea sp. LEGE 06152 TaxID=2777966 RepID=UPI00188089A1|nr:diflavin flavoprotein [Nodosilinea sp. LEGE 06152]MBE9156597.1 diflavin flavoprotein [Nodosilinea sp. LEGE 06152]
MILTTPSASLPTTFRPRDVQVATLGPQSQVLRSRTWDRLKFEVEYSRQRGTTANAYLIQADRVALIDPPGESFTDLFLTELQRHVHLAQLDYIITSHVNANRLATLTRLLELAPQAQIVCSRAAANTLKLALGDRRDRLRPVRSGDTLDLGQGHILDFVGVPTPRWPDGLCTYDSASQILYSDKLFGAHYCGDALWDEQWRQLEDDRRYYFDCLHSSQARQVETALDRLDPLALKTLAPGHGPLVRYSLSRLTHDYRQWCQQQQQSLRVALIYASAYGSTARLADAIAQALAANHIAVETINCELTSPQALIDTLRTCDGIIIGSPTLGGHAPVQIQTALGLILANVPKTKLVGVFGSYGWSGEAIDVLEQKLKDANYPFGFAPLRVRFSPNNAVLEACVAAATEFAQQLRKRQKQQVARPAIAAVQSDRTGQALGRIVGSLCVLTRQQNGVHSGILTAWVSQASFSPPGLIIALPNEAGDLAQISPGSSFGLNILKEGRSVRRHFSTRQGTTTAFDHLPFTLAANQCAILSDALAYVECIVVETLPTGDHTLIYATVARGDLLTPSGIPAISHRQSGLY